MWKTFIYIDTYKRLYYVAYVSWQTELIDIACQFFMIGDRDIKAIDYGGVILKDELRRSRSLPSPIFTEKYNIPITIQYMYMRKRHSHPLPPIRQLWVAVIPKNKSYQIDQVKNHLERRNGVSKKVSLGVALFHHPLLLGAIMKRNPPPGNPAESREKDLEWFKGLGNEFDNMENKSQVLEKRAEGRIKGYLEYAQRYMRSDQRKLNQAQKAVAERILEEWNNRLERNDYNAHYFSRACRDHDDDGDGGPFCNADGLFTCEGEYSEDKCQYNMNPDYSYAHSINPYLTKEARHAFALYELDHQIEKAQVLDRLMRLIRGGYDGKINVGYFYNLLFTRKNMRLVHVKCHVREDHTDKELDETKVLDRENADSATLTSGTNSRRARRKKKCP